MPQVYHMPQVVSVTQTCPPPHLSDTREILDNFNFHRHGFQQHKKGLLVLTEPKLTHIHLYFNIDFYQYWAVFILLLFSNMIHLYEVDTL